MKIAIIPARGGSKRIPRKNIKLFFGKPMIAWSIEAAKASGCFDRIIVSTDDREIADIAQQYGAEVPFMRPADISDDHATTLDVIAHALDWCQSEGMLVDYACCIYATAPFINADDIKKGLDQLVSGDFNYSFSVTTFPFPIQRSLKITESGLTDMFFPQYQQTRSQDLEEAYHDAGQFYWGRSKAFKSQLPIFTSKACVVVLPRYRVQDIDTQDDWEHAEVLFQAIEASGHP